MPFTCVSSTAETQIMVLLPIKNSDFERRFCLENLCNADYEIGGDSTRRNDFDCHSALSNMSTKAISRNSNSQMPKAPVIVFIVCNHTTYESTENSHTNNKNCLFKFIERQELFLIQSGRFGDQLERRIIPNTSYNA